MDYTRVIAGAISFLTVIVIAAVMLLIQALKNRRAKKKDAPGTNHSR
jgi:hypothetical protein